MARSNAEHDDTTGWRPHEVRERASDPDAPLVTHLLTYDEAGRAVAIASLEVISTPGLRSARGELHVDPAIRRQGIGGRTLAGLEEYARGLGRRELVIGATEVGSQVGHGASRSFAPRHGYVVADENMRRNIDWPLPAGALDRWEAEWRPYATDYRFETFLAPTPPRWRAERVRLRSLMSTESPHANLEPEAEVWTEEVLDYYERTTALMGRDMLITVAEHIASGTLAGYTEIAVPRYDPATSWQYDTLVVSAHRGHRLGGLMKVVNMRALADRGTPVERISTFNSTVNGPMIAVNEALGAYVVGERVMWRRSIDEPRPA
jgi:GNAT superfamily N-acetyltransferase